MQRRIPSTAGPDAALESICATSNAVLEMCLNCPTGVRPFVPLAAPLLRAHGDVLELDSLVRQHKLLTRRIAVSESPAAPVDHASLIDAELPQVRDVPRVDVPFPCGRMF